MLNLTRELEEKRRELEDLQLKLAARAKLNDHVPNMRIAEACRKSMEILQTANHYLWLATVPLLET